jgi:DNA-binding response OmpR family regulator
MKKILIADDNRDFCVTMADILSDNDFEVHCVHDGKDVLKRIYNVSPDLLILDIKIKSVPGDEIYKNIREGQFFKELPVIIMTGNIPENINSSANANEVITKPFDMEELMTKIKGILKE